MPSGSIAWLREGGEQSIMARTGAVLVYRSLNELKPVRVRKLPSATYGAVYQTSHPNTDHLKHV